AEVHRIVGLFRHAEHHLEPVFDFALLALVGARKQVLQQQLVLGDPLHRLDQVGVDRMQNGVLLSDIVEKGASALDQQQVRVRLVFAILDVDVETGRPGDETVADIFGNLFILFQLLQEYSVKSNQTVKWDQRQTVAIITCCGSCKSVRCCQREDSPFRED